MTAEVITYNLYPVFKFVIILFAIVGGYNLLSNLFNLLSRGFKDKLDNTKDMSIFNGLIAKYPNVAPDFFNKSSKEQAIDNNNEIHEINKRLDKIQFYLDRLNLHQSMTLDEVKK